jgi:hypothetical protein
MTVCKPSSSQTEQPKQAPRRVSKSIKVNPGSFGEAETMEVPSDSLLQSPTSRRRYMRRGSRAPSMFMLSNINLLAPSFDERDDNRFERRDSVGTDHKKQLSLISLLGLQLQTKVVLEPDACSASPHSSQQSPNRKQLSVPSIE